MGPRAFAHGDGGNSHELFPVFAASMGPRAFAHGDQAEALIPRSAHSAASMGPRAFAHGDADVLRNRRARWPGFNGAAGFRPRRPVTRDYLSHPLGNASMGPRAFAHGDIVAGYPSSQHDFASMGPRAFAHGDLTATVL